MYWNNDYDIISILKIKITCLRYVFWFWNKRKGFVGISKNKDCWYKKEEKKCEYFSYFYIF